MHQCKHLKKTKKKPTINPPPTRMLGFNVPQCLSLLFILFILNTSAEMGFHVFALDNLNKRCFVPGGLFFFLPWQTLKIIIKETQNMIWNVLLWQISKKNPCFLSIFSQLAGEENKWSYPEMRGNCADISGGSCSASLNPLVLKRKRKWKRKSLQCSSSTAALMSPCSRRMFVEITWFALVISPVHLKTAVSFRLTAVCEAIGGFISLLFAFRAMLPICRGFFSIKGSFSH